MAEELEERSEVLSREEALFAIFVCLVVSFSAFYLHNRRRQQQLKQVSLQMNYKFNLPPEKELFEAKKRMEPTEEKQREAWHKECCAILLRRAIMDITLHMKVSKDYQDHSIMYQRGITLDIWPQVKAARRALDRELESVKYEAEWLRPGWGNSVFQQAAQVRHHLAAMDKKQMLAMQKKQQHLKREKERQLKQESDRKKSEEVAKELIREEEEAMKNQSKNKNQSKKTK